MKDCTVAMSCDALQSQIAALEEALLAFDTSALDAAAQQLHAELRALMQAADSAILAPRLAAHAQRLGGLRAHLARLQALVESQGATLLPRAPEVVMYGRQGRCL